MTPLQSFFRRHKRLPTEAELSAMMANTVFQDGRTRIKRGFPSLVNPELEGRMMRILQKVSPQQAKPAPKPEEKKPAKPRVPNFATRVMTKEKIKSPPPKDQKPPVELTEFYENDRNIPLSELSIQAKMVNGFLLSGMSIEETAEACQCDKEKVKIYKLRYNLPRSK